MKTLVAALFVLFIAIAARADETLFRYEGDVHPLDPSAGWRIGSRCEPPCSEFMEDGHFVFFWSEAAEFASYDLSIARAPEPPPHAVGRVALPFKLSARPDLHGLRRLL